MRNLIKGVMETTGWTLEQAMTALNVPEAEWHIYQNLLKSNHKSNAGKPIMVPSVFV